MKASPMPTNTWVRSRKLKYSSFEVKTLYNIFRLNPLLVFWEPVELRVSHKPCSYEAQTLDVVGLLASFGPVHKKRDTRRYHEDTKLLNAIWGVKLKWLTTLRSRGSLQIIWVLSLTPVLSGSFGGWTCRSRRWSNCRGEGRYLCWTIG
jgi:hypothetical protein